MEGAGQWVGWGSRRGGGSQRSGGSGREGRSEAGSVGEDVTRGRGRGRGAELALFKRGMRGAWVA